MKIADFMIWFAAGACTVLLYLFVLVICVAPLLVIIIFDIKDFLPKLGLILTCVITFPMGGVVWLFFNRDKGF